MGQAVLGIVIAVGYLIASKLMEGVSENWFILIMASFFVIVGMAQFFTARKELKEYADPVEEKN